MNPSPEQRQRLSDALKERDAQYDPAEKMLARKLGTTYQYHTNLRGIVAHPTRESLTYAVALLETGDGGREKRALDVLRRVLALQDTDPASPSLGIWGWYLEEPPAKMSPPDYNWADFLGVQLLQIVLFHRDRLPSDVSRDVDAALKRATTAIRKRNVGPGYTNIAIMGAYVTLIAAEVYDDADLLGYALARLQTFHDHTMVKNDGAFTEYNSPTYTVVALDELARLRRDVQTPEAKPLVETLYRAAWAEIAHHFHVPTRQWAGPHSRAYSDLLNGSARALIERSTSGDAAVNESRLPTPCPPDLQPFFATLDKPRTLVKTFVKDEKAPLIGTTHLAPAFALGTINRGDLWNQRRALIAYWGDKNAPSYLRLRVLHDGYDFAAARFWGQQREGSALAVLNIATDGGDKHPSLDRLKDATVRAADLRLRWEIGGAGSKTELPTPPVGIVSTPIGLRFGDLRVDLAVPYARWGDQGGRWEINRDDNTSTVHLDVVLYHGPERDFRLNELESAALGVAVRLSVRDEPLWSVSAETSDGRLALAWDGLRVAAPLRPGPSAALAGAVSFAR